MDTLKASIRSRLNAVGRSKNQLTTLLAWCSIILFCVQCATPGQLNGGEKDETPPQLDSLNSTPNFQTNFYPTTLELTFDEWVQLKDVFSQVVVSPPLEKNPVVRLKKKTVIVDFEESGAFRENATYSINFGEAVSDLNEGNVPDNLKYVFSTGDYIDSLEVQGKVVDAITKEAKEDVLVMLYDNLADTVVRTERPFYFAKTSEQGTFRITNVRADTFKLFALVDANRNYLFDEETEEIAFPDSTIVLNDSLRPIVALRLFKEQPSLQLINNEQQYGLLKLTFNQPPEGLTYRYEPNLSTLLFDYEKDTVRVWYNFNTTDSSQFIPVIDTLVLDTFQLNSSTKAAFLEKSTLKLSPNVPKKLLPHPTKPFSLLFNHPLASFDTALITLLEDTTAVRVTPSIQIDSSAAARQLLLSYNWKPDVPYQLLVEPEGLTDIFGLSLKDSIQRPLEIKPLKEFGNIQLTISNLDSLTAYVVELWQGDQNFILKETVTDAKTWQQEYKTLKPAKYKLKIITDQNRNGKWDTGNYNQQLQPEPILIQELEQLRANWDLVSEIILEE